MANFDSSFMPLLVAGFDGIRITSSMPWMTLRLRYRVSKMRVTKAVHLKSIDTNARDPVKPEFTVYVR